MGVTTRVDTEISMGASMGVVGTSTTTDMGTSTDITTDINMTGVWW